MHNIERKYYVKSTFNAAFSILSFSELSASRFISDLSDALSAFKASTFRASSSASA
jgi:hypothetical protein